MAYNKKEYSKEELEIAAKLSVCYSDIFRNLGIKINGGSYNWLKKILKKHQVDISHFSSKNTGLINAGILATRRKIKELFDGVTDISNGERRPSKKLRTFLLFNKIEELCNVCGLKEWLGIPIRLDIDHKDGNSLNNSLENLQFICPNCHRQKTIPVSYGKASLYQSDFQQNSLVSARPKKEHFCLDCKASISGRAERCRKCGNKFSNTGKFKISWPEDEILQRMLWEIPTSHISKTLGISDSAIGKRCKNRKLTKPPAGYWTKRKLNKI